MLVWTYATCGDDDADTRSQAKGTYMQCILTYYLCNCKYLPYIVEYIYIVF